MRLENILREKVYAFATHPETSEAENTILKEISARNKLGDFIGSSIIDNNDNYDSYRLDTSDGHFCVKLSIIPEDDILERDFLALEALIDRRFPYAICQGELKEYGARYSVSSFVYAQSCAEIGKSFISQNKDNFLKLIKNLAAQNITSETFYNQLRQNYFDNLITDLPEFKQVDFAKDEEILTICIQELAATRQIIEENFDSSMNEGGFCHGRITPSRTLVRENDFSLINFEDHYQGNPLLDILSLRYEFFITDSVEAYFVENFVPKSFSKALYKKHYNIVKAMKFHDLITDFIKQVYIYKGVRQRKILELTEKMSRSFGHFAGLPPFERHRDKIGELFSTSVI
jgi:hypothetical protein